MDRALMNRITRTVLYEGYVLYPYRRSSLKNSKPCGFGILYPESRPRAGSDRSHFQAECLLAGPETTTVSVLVRFLQLMAGQEGVEREMALDARLAEIQGVGLRRPFRFDEVEGEIGFAAAPAAAGVFKLTLSVHNTSRAEAQDDLLHSLVSAHAVLSAAGARFVSLTDPPAWLADAAAGCVNEGVWPVLVGEPGARDTMLASPIILPDYPQVAPESAGDLYDATEIEEILTLRVLTLTDEEKAEARASGERARALLERAETLPEEHLMRLHGTIRGLAPEGAEPWSAWDAWANPAPVKSLHVKGAELKAGDRVRLRPGKRADIFDSALDGRIAVITAIEQDFESKIHVAVVVEDDPGRDLGEMRQSGHRFFFAPSEIEPL